MGPFADILLDIHRGPTFRFDADVMSRTFIIILAATIGCLAALAYAITGPAAYVFRPGQVFSGHQRFQDACQACHLPWSGPDPGKCVSCHANVMMFNTHSDAKLEAPLRVEVDEKYRKYTCVNCHREHISDDLAGALYTGKPAMCMDCHPAYLRSDHQAHDSRSCVQDSCHSYHINISRADFGKDSRARLLLKTRAPARPKPAKVATPTPEALEQMRRSAFYNENPVYAAKHSISAHATTEATCQRCHTSSGKLVEKPSLKVCAECHPTQFYGFSSGGHGAARARDAGRFSTPRENVGCGSCHDTHSLLLGSARREACKRCHDSKHTLNYEKSGHYRYISDPVFALKPVTGVDCAGCHMPKLEELNGHTMHNESYSSSRKRIMAVMVCDRCHGMKFSLESLYDPDVISYNFTYTSKKPIPPGLQGHFKAAGVE